MTITELNETGITGTVAQDGSREYQVTYTVISDSRTDSVVQVFNALPAQFSSLNFKGTIDAGVQLKTYAATYLQEQDSKKVWQAVCTYNNKPESGSGGRGVDVGRNINQPDLWPPRIWGSFTGRLVEIERDTAGRPVVNPIGDKFRDAVRTKAELDLNIEKTYSSIDLTTIDDAVDKVNSAAFFGGEVGTFLLESAEWEQVYHGADKHYVVHYRFLYSPIGHRFRPRLEGPRYFVDTTDKETKPFTSDDGFAYGDGYGNLNTDGTKRAVTEAPLFYGVLAWDGSVVAPDGWVIYESIDFISTLNLPSGF